MPMLSLDEVDRVIALWQNTSDEDFERILADFMPQGTLDKIAIMIQQNTTAGQMFPGEIGGAFIAGLELGWFLAAECEARGNDE